MKKIALYFHIPFCKHKCGYCDFLSFVPKDKNEIDSYLNYVKREIGLYDHILKNREITSIYFGGGTPSLIKAEGLNFLLDELKKYQFSNDCEISLEANPESFLSLDPKKLVENGFNRLSLGVQTGNRELLKKIERIHTLEEAKEAYDLAKKAGFTNINLDFISSIPGEEIENIEETLSFIRDLQPNHISVYSLILEKNTKFFNLVQEGKMELLEEEVDRIHLETYRKGLEDLGYEQYEISNFSKPGFQCKHNLNYWKLGEYLGLGLGAHSNYKKFRFWNRHDRIGYYQDIDNGKKPIEDWEELSEIDRTNEFVMLGIRLMTGIEKNSILPNGKVFDQYFRDVIEDNLKRGLLELVGTSYRLTETGKDLSNLVERSFFNITD